VRSRVFTIKHTLPPTRVLIAIHVKRTAPEDEPSGSKHVEDTEVKN
jgi:hypothetical protein